MCYMISSTILVCLVIQSSIHQRTNCYYILIYIILQLNFSNLSISLSLCNRPPNRLVLSTYWIFKTYYLYLRGRQTYPILRFLPSSTLLSKFLTLTESLSTLPCKDTVRFKMEVDSVIISPNKSSACRESDDN